MTYNCTASEVLSLSFIAKEILKQLIGLILFALYARLIYVLLRNQKVYSNVFYKLIIVNGVTACVCYLSFLSASKYPMLVYFLGNNLGLLDQWSYSLGFMVFLWYHSALCNFIGSLLMSLNRMSTIVNIKFFHWDHRFCWILVIYFTAPTLLFFQLIGAKAQLIPICYVDNSLLNSFDYNTKLSFDLPGWEETYLAMAMFTDGLFLVSSFLINLLTVGLFLRKRSDGVDAKKTVEKYASNLLLILVGDLICHSFWNFTDITTYFYVHKDYDTPLLEHSYSISMQLIEIAPLLPGFWVISCSPSIRKEMSFTRNRRVGQSLVVHSRNKSNPVTTRTSRK